MDLTTTYMGLELKNPLVVSASPLSGEIENLKKMEAEGAAAVVLYSLFEEQIAREAREFHDTLTQHTDSFAEAQSFFPEPDDFVVGPEGYLNHIRRAKEAVKIPVIASLNGSTMGGWIDFATRIQEAGADALELNIYSIPTDKDLPGARIEENYVKILKKVKSTVKIPVALKLSPYFSNMANMAKKLDEAGADALVLFNRFYQPDVDLEELEIRPSLILSSAHAARLPLTWVGILFGHIRADLAATRGIYTVEDVVKMIMVGANVTMLCSLLLTKGIGEIGRLLGELTRWLEQHEYKSVREMRGSMSQIRYEDPTAFERAQYIRSLQSFRLP